MRVPVLWVSRHPDTVIPRGYADQGFLEAVFAREVWTPADPVEFVHCEVTVGAGEQWIWEDAPDEEFDCDGGVIVLPARHHASPDDVEWFKAFVDRFAWSVVILSGDEEWVFPWREIPETDRRKVWIMQPRAEHSHLTGIPGGWYPGTHEAIAAEHRRARIRPLDVMFAGQVTHSRRRALVEELRRLRGLHVFRHETAGYLQGIPQAEYFQLIAGAKVVPCPSGPAHVDTARAFEALEAGAVPIVDCRTPSGDDMAYYWRQVLGFPLPGVLEWSGLQTWLDGILPNWASIANEVFANWQRWKRDITCKLDADIREVAGAPSRSTEPDDLITVVITTSPAELHPSISHLCEVVQSVRDQLPRAEVLIVADGVRPEQDHLKERYEEYVRRVTWWANNDWHNVRPIVLEEWGHQVNAVRAALEEVTTPLVLMAEHDTPLEGSIDWQSLAIVVDTDPKVNAVRFHHETHVLPDHEHLMYEPWPLEPEPDDPSPDPEYLIPTAAWWQRPHLATARFYREQVLTQFPEEARTFVEDHLYGVVKTACEEGRGEEWGVYIYCPDPDDMKRSGHLDSRGDEPKYAQWLDPEVGEL